MPGRETRRRAGRGGRPPGGRRAADIRPVEAIARWAPPPVLLIVGARDALVPPAETDRLAAAAGGTARVARFASAGHPSSDVGEAWRKEPDRYRAEVLAFFDAAVAAR